MQVLGKVFDQKTFKHATTFGLTFDDVQNKRLHKNKG
jgi:hypothetical protein